MSFKRMMSRLFRNTGAFGLAWNSLTDNPSRITMIGIRLIHAAPISAQT